MHRGILWAFAERFAKLNVPYVHQSAEDMTSAACKQGKSSPDPMDTKVWLWVVCFYAYLIRRWIGFGSPGNSLDLPARAF